MLICFIISRRQNNSTNNQVSGNPSNSPTTANESVAVDTPVSSVPQPSNNQQRPRIENGSNNNSPTCKLK